MSLCTFSISSTHRLGRLRTLTLFLLLVTSLAAQIPNPSDSSLYRLEPLRLYRIDSVHINGNKKTKERIILRELVNHPGDSLTASDLRYFLMRSQQNLINTSLFIFVVLRPEFNADSSQVSIQIDVKERWYIWPQPIFEIQDRNVNSWLRTKDLFRINYGLAFAVNNVSGRRDRLSILIRRGYAEKYAIGYSIPFINKAQTWGLGGSYGYSRNNEVAYRTFDNQQQFFRNYTSYMRFEQEAKVEATYRPSLYQRHVFEARYNKSRVSDTIFKLNNDYYLNNSNTIQYFSLSYSFINDHRDNKQYPLRGWYTEATLVKNGLGLLPQESINNTFVVLGLRDYWKAGKRLFLANSIKGRLMFSGSQPYYFNRALGFNDFVRGYEYYVIDGQDFALCKTSLKYQLIRPRIIELKRLNWAKKFNTIPYALYFTLNGDAGWVNDRYYYKNNPLSNTLLFGYGCGLDFVSYYDYVLRLEFSVNRAMEKGLFIHLTAAI